MVSRSASTVRKYLPYKFRKSTISTVVDTLMKEWLQLPYHTQVANWISTKKTPQTSLTFTEIKDDVPDLDITIITSLPIA